MSFRSKFNILFDATLTSYSNNSKGHLNKNKSFFKKLMQQGCYGEARKRKNNIIFSLEKISPVNSVFQKRKLK